MVLSNLVDVGASNFIADAVFVFIKLCIVALNTVLAWVLVRNTEFGEVCPDQRALTGRSVAETCNAL